MRREYHLILIDSLRALQIAQGKELALRESVSDEKGMKLTELMYKIDGNNATLSRVLTEIIELGLVESRVPEKHNLYYLTKKGYECIKEFNKWCVNYGLRPLSIYTLFPLSKDSIRLVRDKNNLLSPSYK